MTRAELLNKRNQLKEELNKVEKEIKATFEIGDKVSYQKTSCGLRKYTVYATIVGKVFDKKGNLKYFTVHNDSHIWGLDDECNKSPLSLELVES